MCTGGPPYDDMVGQKVIGALWMAAAGASELAAGTSPLPSLIHLSLGSLVVSCARAIRSTINLIDLILVEGCCSAKQHKTAPLGHPHDAEPARISPKMDVTKAVSAYIDRMITEVPGMKVLLLDAETVSDRPALADPCCTWSGRHETALTHTLSSFSFSCVLLCLTWTTDRPLERLTDADHQHGLHAVQPPLPRGLPHGPHREHSARPHAPSQVRRFPPPDARKRREARARAAGAQIRRVLDL